MEIADWLRRLSLERYAETFRDNAIDVGEGSTFSFTYLRDHSCQADCDRREKANRVRKPGEPMRPVPMITIRRASVYSGTREAPC